MRLKDRVAVVTGGARGIGQAVCRALADAGAAIAVVDVLAPDETVGQLRNAGARVLEVVADISDARSTREMARTVVERFGRIDILVNNAAVLPPYCAFDAIDEAAWERVMAVNVRGTWLCSKAVIPAMRTSGHGRILNIASDTVWSGVPMLLHYVTSKGAIIAMTRALARELAGSGVTVNALTPGFTFTEGTRGMADADALAPISAAVLDQQILKRPLLPSDVAAAVVFLASPEAECISGQTVNVDGGATHH